MPATLSLADVRRAWDTRDPELPRLVAQLAEQPDPTPEKPIRDGAPTFDRFLNELKSWDYRRKTKEDQAHFRVERLKALEAPDAEVPLPDRLRVHAVILDLWAANDPFARSCLLEIIATVPLAYGPWRALKRIFKESEANGDTEISILRDAGLDVSVGVCAAEAWALNAPFFKLVRTGRPWVIAKWAMTLDGRIATRTGDSKWISGEASRRRVHELRGRVDAVIVGRGTVVADNPQLTARPPGPRTATRVVLSASGELPERCQLRATARDVPVLVFTAAGNEGKLAGWAADGAEVVSLVPSLWEGGGNQTLNVDDVLAELGRWRMTNVLVEGGAGVLGAFADAGAIDEVWAFVAPVIVGGSAAPSPVGGLGVGRLADGLRLADPVTEVSGDDLWIRGRVRRV